MYSAKQPLSNEGLFYFCIFVNKFGKYVKKLFTFTHEYEAGEMESRLTLQAVQFLAADEELQQAIAPYLGLKARGVEAAINRNSKCLTTWYAVEAIAGKMGVQPESIVGVK